MGEVWAWAYIRASGDLLGCFSRASVLVQGPPSGPLSRSPSVGRTQRITLRDTHFHQTLLTVLHTLDSGLPRPSQGSWPTLGHQAGHEKLPALAVRTHGSSTKI